MAKLLQEKKRQKLEAEIKEAARKAKIEEAEKKEAIRKAKIEEARIKAMEEAIKKEA